METYKIGDFEIKQWVVGALNCKDVAYNDEYYYLVNKVQGNEKNFVAKVSMAIDKNDTDFKQLIATRDAQIAKIVNFNVEDLKIPLPKSLQIQ